MTSQGLQLRQTSLTCSLLMALTVLGNVLPACAEPPTCSDKTVKGNVEHEADRFMSVAHKLTGVADEGKTAEMNERARAILFPTTIYEVNLSEMYETSHTEAIRSCAGKLTLKSAERTDADVELTYDAVKTEDGKILFRVQNGPGLYLELIQNYVKLNQLDPLIYENQRATIEEIQHDLAKAFASMPAGVVPLTTLHPDINTPFDTTPHGGRTVGSHSGQGGPVPNPISGSRRAPQ